MSTENNNELSDKEIYNNYLSNKKIKNEIPMYDPHTGEANPFYEELTGEPNPLLIDEKIKLEMISPCEPKRKNRWLVKFPKEMGISTYMVQSTNRPNLEIINKKFFNYTYKTKLNWEEISFILVDPISPSSTQGMFNWIKKYKNKKFNYTLEILDPTGVVVECWLIKDCVIKSINYGDLSYKKDGITLLNLKVKPKTCELLF